MLKLSSLEPTPQEIRASIKPGDENSTPSEGDGAMSRKFTVAQIKEFRAQAAAELRNRLGLPETAGAFRVKFVLLLKGNAAHHELETAMDGFFQKLQWSPTSEREIERAA